MLKTRDNHYVPQWYQRSFLKDDKKNSLIYLNLHPDQKKLPNGKVITFNYQKNEPTSQCKEDFEAKQDTVEE